jgi:predicted signal transduction protein with EAL and GGDEF domain
LSNADIALYAAKADGRGRWRVFEPEMDTRIQARRLLELELRNAVANGDITVNFQPIVDAMTRRITAFEALARWRSPTRGNVSPSDFIPLLEETGLIHEVGAAMLRRACAACARWPDNIAISVNLSPIQFREMNLRTTITEALASSGLQPHRLILEITESRLFEDRIGVRDTLASLRTRGVQVSLDDFGTGYSNFGHLHSYPFDRIKIDRSFTSDLGRNQTSCDLVESIADLGRRLRKPVVAEGVETLTQLNTVRFLKISEAQGYLFGRPVPESEVAGLVARDNQSDIARLCA